MTAEHRSMSWMVLSLVGMGGGMGISLLGCLGMVESDSRSDGLGNIMGGDEVCEVGEEFCDEAGQGGQPGDEVDEPGEDDDELDEIDLPYDIKMVLGVVYRPIADAFAEEGAFPAEFTVDLNGTDWRADELTSNAPFEITPEDCDHAGNRDTGRDRVFVSWTGPDGEETDHLDLRYCED